MPQTPIAIVYAGTNGHTKQISQTLAAHLEELQCHTHVLAIEEFSNAQLANYDTVVFGSAIRYGRHIKAMVDFLTVNRDVLHNKKTVFFSVNLTARKANRNTPQTSNYIKKLCVAISWRPNLLAVFAGKLNYPVYSWSDRTMIRFIMWLTNGPTAPDSVVDYTDWDKVKVLANDIRQLQLQGMDEGS